MKQIKLIKPIFLAFLFASCANIRKESAINRSDVKEIKISESFDNHLKIDSIFSSITPIRLETNEKNLIKECKKMLVFNEQIYILNSKTNLYVFSLKGKFIQEISKQGRGPGEFFELRDFQIDKHNNIYILDYGRILKFSKNGNLLEQYNFREFCANNKCNPLEFALTEKLDEFYLWGGSFGIKRVAQNKCYALYRIDKNGTIKQKYFPVDHLIVGNCNRFRTFKNLTNIEPVFGNDTIYAIEDDCFKARYAINCGKRSLKEKVPQKLHSLSQFKLKVSKDYFINFRNFIETEAWLHFNFSYKRIVYNAYHCKKSNKTFVAKTYPRVFNRLTPNYMYTSYGDKMIAIFPAYNMVNEIERLMKNKSELTDKESRLISSLVDVEMNDNPVLLFCQMKD